MVNKQSVSPPIPHLHALLTSGDEPPVEVDIFDLLKASYEVQLTNILLLFCFDLFSAHWKSLLTKAKETRIFLLFPSVYTRLPFI